MDTLESRLNKAIRLHAENDDYLEVRNVDYVYAIFKESFIGEPDNLKDYQQCIGRTHDISQDGLDTLFSFLNLVAIPVIKTRTKASLESLHNSGTPEFNEFERTYTVEVFAFAGHTFDGTDSLIPIEEVETEETNKAKAMSIAYCKKVEEIYGEIPEDTSLTEVQLSLDLEDLPDTDATPRKKEKPIVEEKQLDFPFKD
jgi:hypothetical protein